MTNAERAMEEALKNGRRKSDQAGQRKSDPWATVEPIETSLWKFLVVVVALALVTAGPWIVGAVKIAKWIWRLL